MSIFVGSNEILAGNLKIGGTDIQEVYVGSQKVWPPGPPPPPNIEYAYVGSMSSIAISVHNLSGVYLIKDIDGTRIDIPEFATQFLVDLGTGTVMGYGKVYFPDGNVFSDSVISFNHEGVSSTGVIIVDLIDVGSLKSLANFARGIQGGFNLNVDADTSGIEDIYAFAMNSGLQHVPDMDYTGIRNGQSAFNNANFASIQVQELHIPGMTNGSHMFAGCMHTGNWIDTLNIVCPSLNNAYSMFDGAAIEHIDMTGSGSLGDAKNMFKDVDSLSCITGVLDTTNADTAGMFTGSEDTLIRPSQAEQQDLIAGTRWENDECEIPTPAPLVPPLTSNNGPDLMVSAQHNNMEAWHAFDRQSNSAWNPGGGVTQSSITVNFDNEKTFTEFSITADERTPACPPTYLVVSGFSDSFVEIYRNEYFAIDPGETIVIPLSNATKFTKFKVDVRNSVIDCTARGINVTELQVTGY